ncbi:MAG: heavy metal translocating P-type ATPase [Candidatus Izemoplasmataceae bacterium]
MIKKIVMKNLICSGCAARIEKSLSERSDIHSASFNFANQTMLLDTDESFDVEKEIDAIRTLVDSIENGVDVMPYASRHQISTRNFLKAYRFVFIGALIFLLGGVLDYFDILRPRINMLYWAGYALIAKDIIQSTIKGVKRREFFNENLLMFIATFAAMFIEKPFEAALVIIFYSIGEHLQHKAVDKSKSEISSLMDLHVEYANVRVNGHVVVKDPMHIKKGDTLVVKNGEKIPTDGIIIEGSTALNTSALTGESKLSEVHPGDYVRSGNINTGRVIELRAETEYDESTIAKIIDLIENSTNQKSKTENFITKFARYYTPLVTFAAMLMFAIPTYVNPAGIDDYVFRAATFLVISCPCALVLSIPLSYFAGIGASAREGILFKGSNILDMMNEVDAIGIDKTGTLTHGNFEVAGYSDTLTLKYAASLEQYSNHPIAQSIVKAYHGNLKEYKNVEEIAGQGMRAQTDEGLLLVGSKKMLEDQGITLKDEKDLAGTNVFVSLGGRYIGQVVVKDQIRESSIATIRALAKTKTITMLTGDNEATAQEVAYELGNIDTVHSLLPEDKINVFNKLPSKKHKMYIGDGINDAPLLKNADIGVAMGHGSELAIDVADVIIMDDDLSLIDRAFHLSKRTRRIVYQNIALSLIVKFSFLGLAGFGQISMLEAIFADVGITLIAVLNALRLIYRKRGVRHAK